MRMKLISVLLSCMFFVTAWLPGCQDCIDILNNEYDAVFERLTILAERGEHNYSGEPTQCWSYYFGKLEAFDTAMEIFLNCENKKPP